MGTAQLAAYRLAKRGWRSVVAVDEEPERLAVACNETQQHGIGCRGGAVLDGEAQALIVAADQIAGGIDPGVEVGAAPQRLADVAAGALGHVVDEHEGEVVTAVDVAQEAQWYAQCYLTIPFRINSPICATLSVPPAYL